MQADENRKPRFEFLDRSRQVEITERNLPHWFQAGAALFVTFRTYDSLPKQVVLQSRNELRRWLVANNLSPKLAEEANDSKQIHATNERIQALELKKRDELRKLRIRLWQQNLDECHGACLLRQKEVSEIVYNALLSLDGDRYDLDSFVIMPNHVHTIVQFKNGYDQTMIGQSWLRYTARKINMLLGQRGAIWQSEPYDHIIRNEFQFVYLQKYIKDNPKNAQLKSNEFVYWDQEM